MREGWTSDVCLAIGNAKSDPRTNIFIPNVRKFQRQDLIINGIIAEWAECRWEYRDIIMTLRRCATVTKLIFNLTASGRDSDSDWHWTETEDKGAGFRPTSVDDNETIDNAILCSTRISQIVARISPSTRVRKCVRIRVRIGVCALDTRFSQFRVQSTHKSTATGTSTPFLPAIQRNNRNGLSALGPRHRTDKLFR